MFAIPKPLGALQTPQNSHSGSVIALIFSSPSNPQLAWEGWSKPARASSRLPSEPVRIDDILRRTIQLVKLHRDNLYFTESEQRKEAWPISVIIVTLAGRAFENIWATRRNSFTSPIEVVLAVIEDMPNWITRNANGHYLVCNPALDSENFAERWNTDQGLRASEFFRWHSAWRLTSKPC